MPFRSLALLVLVLAVVSQSRIATAQPKPAVPKLPPQFPTLTSPTHLGVKTGAATELTLTGTNLADASDVLVTIPNAKATITKGSAKPTSVALSIQVPAEATVGLYQIRVITPHGISNARNLCVDDLPAIVKKAGNSKKESPMQVPVPCVVTGEIAVETSDFYRITVPAGQRLTIEALARRLGSPLDPVIVLHDAKSGREMPALYADDTPGLQSDARITYTFPQAMDILVEIRDTTYKGGGEHAYRLRIGDFPSATTAFPLAIESGKTAPIGFAGPFLDGVAPKSVKAEGRVQLVAPQRSGGPQGWGVPALVSSQHPELSEAEPNNERAQANKIPVPGGVSGRFEQKGDLDTFAFPGKKGQKLELIARTYDINSPAEVLLKVVDAKGAEVAKSNPTQPTARAEFTPAADGEFFVQAEHLNYGHGPNEIYHLTIKPAAPDFEVELGNERIDLSAGGQDQIAVVGRAKLNGFNLPVELTVVSDALEGKLTIPAAANPQPAAPLLMSVKLKPGAKPGLIPFTVLATAKIDGKDVSRTAHFENLVKAGFAGLPNVPLETTTQLHAMNSASPLYIVTATLEKAASDKGTTVKGKFQVKRSAGFAEEIAVAMQGLPANVTAKVKPIPKDKNEIEFEIVAAANAAPGAINATVRASAKSAGRDFAYEFPIPALTITEPKKPEPKKSEPKKPEPKKK